MDSKNIIIAVLSVTAVVLFCTLVLVHTSERSIAWADTVDRGRGESDLGGGIGDERDGEGGIRHSAGSAAGVRPKECGLAPIPFT